MSEKRKTKVTFLKKKIEQHEVLKRQQENFKKNRLDAEEIISGSINTDLIDPPFDFQQLIDLADQSSILQQCIDAYKTNITTFGLEVKEKVDVNNLKDAEQKELENELSVLNGYLHYLNTETPIEEVLEAVQDDLEKTGNAFIEIIRDNSGAIATLEHLPVNNMRISKIEKKAFNVKRTVDIGSQSKEKIVSKRFRKYAQVVGTNIRYFKEYGHPLDLNYKTGDYGEKLDIKSRANEVIHFKIGNATYGKPRWIGNLIAILGSRKAEELNYYYFTNGRHLPAAITVDNGQLDDESMKNLNDYMDSATGVENAHKFLLLEAKGDSYEDIDGKSKTANTKIDIKSLAEVIQQDALFLDYNKNARNQVRSSFRLPPLYTGETEDYTRSTSETSQKITEEQVFQPERRRFARKLNSVILPELELSKVKLSFKNADFKDPIEIAKVLTPFIQAMAVSPNDLRPLLQDLLGIPLDAWEEEAYNRPVFVPQGHNAEGHKFLQELESITKRAEDNDMGDVAIVLKELRDVMEDLDYDKISEVNPVN